MTRRHADDIVVQRGQLDGIEGSGGIEGPVQFRWGERLYVVREVLDQWVEAGAWWRQPTFRVTGASGAAGVDDRERELWRVEAATAPIAGHGGPPGVFDLCFDWSAGQWSLVRVHD